MLLLNCCISFFHLSIGWHGYFSEKKISDHKKRNGKKLEISDEQKKFNEFEVVGKKWKVILFCVTISGGVYGGNAEEQK